MLGEVWRQLQAWVPGVSGPEALEHWLAEVARVCGPLVRGRVRGRAAQGG